MKQLILLFLVAMSIHVQAQETKNSNLTPGIISGKVIDQSSKEVLPYVNIVVKDLTKKIITGGITSLDGKFKIKNIPQKTSIVEIQFIGYKTFSKEININAQNKKINLGIVSLIEDATTLDEVEIRAEVSTVLQKVDRKVINVGKDLTSVGATASELLNNVQSVSVDSQSGAISLRGNENVRVLVDGKPSNIPSSQLLKQLPSTSIKSVELITNPSAKYNPEGMSGIINIILNKSANTGFNGTINTGLEAGHYVRYNASTNMNYKTGKVNFFGNYGYNGGDRYNMGYINRPNVNNQDFVFIDDSQSHLFKIGADIYLNNKNTLSFYTTQNWSNNESNGIATISDNDGIVVNRSPNKQDKESSNQTYNINFKHDFDQKGHHIEFEATYSKNNAPQQLENSELTDLTDGRLNFFNAIENNGENTLVNIDYTNPISKEGKLELGIEYRVNTTDNTNITDQVGFSDSSFSYDRDIYSAYANYGHKFGKLTMQAGARLEYYEIQGIFNQVGQETATVSDDIFTIYPSAFFTYNPSDKNQWQFSYSRRVDRPGIQQVNPIREWSTPLITSVGNPDLVPQFTNSLELNYTRNITGGSVTIGTFYRNVNDVINRATSKDPNDPSNVRQIISFSNFDDTSAYGIEASSNYKIASWWRANASMDFYSQKQFGTIDMNNPTASTKEVTAEIFNARISNNFKVSNRLRLQLFAMYRGPQKDIQWNVKSMKMVNLGANLSVLKNKGNVSFRVNDIFNNMKFKFDATNPFVQNGQFKWESRTAYIGFNYRFGGGKNRAKSRRTRDNNEKQSGGGFL